MLTLLATALAAPVDLTLEVDALGTSVRSVDAATCDASLNGAFERLAAIDPSTVDRRALDTTALVDQVWTIRLDAQERLIDLHADGPVPTDCITGFRRIDLASRYLIDHLLLETPDARPWLTTTDLQDFDDLRAGDILVTRGAGLSSAGIAHIGRIDSQFSHNAMVHVRPDGTRWTVEAYLERGGLVQPLETFLEHGLGRVLVLRHDDAALAAEAARLAHDRIAHGDPIDYDEAFDDSDDGDELFCSEIGPWAFAMAGGPTDMPLHKTVFPRDVNPAMFDAMGIDRDLLSAPVDLVFDPRFRIVGEWRALDHLEEMRRHDAVVEALFHWMEEEGYALDQKWRHRTTVRIGLAVRKTPILGRLLSSMVHPNGDVQFLVAGLALQEAGERLWADFQDALGDAERPSYAEMQQILEDIRKADLAVWTRKPRRATVHRVIHPSG
jgi:hypothetical protein